MECECIVCGKSFITTYQGRRFCSNACQHEYAVNTATCPVCGVRLIEKGVLTGKGYCSEKCQEEARIQRAIQDGRYIDCEHCGKKFIRSSERSRFCSKACYEAQRLEHQAALVCQRESKSVRKPETERTCPVCGTVFPITPQQTSKRFCSMECRKKASAATPKKAPVKPKPEHLCSSCRISQTDCDRFFSGFKSFPHGAKTRVMKGHIVVSECPKYKE